MPRLQKCASARRKRQSVAVRGNMSFHNEHDDDDDFMDPPPPRLNIPVKCMCSAALLFLMHHILGTFYNGEILLQIYVQLCGDTYEATHLWRWSELR